MIVVDTATPGGNQARFVCREDTSDGNLVRAVCGGDEYRLAGLDLEGWAIDVGAHIGSVAVPLALDHPGLSVLALDPVPSNIDMTRRNAAINGVADRVIPRRLAAAAPGTDRVSVGYGYDELHRFVGNLHGPQDAPVVTDTPAVSLGVLLEEHGIDEVALMKVDCEGCEVALLSDPAVARVRLIVGEIHGTYDRVSELLEPTHNVEPDRHYLFRAVRR